MQIDDEHPLIISVKLPLTVGNDRTSDADPQTRSWLRQGPGAGKSGEARLSSFDIFERIICAG